MAQKIVFVSDLSGAELDGDSTTLVWGYEGRTLEIDLTDTERKAFAKAVAKYLDASRTVKHGDRSATPATPKRSRTPQNTGTPLDNLRGAARAAELERIRAWGEKTGVPVNPRGRMAIEHLQAYYAAQHAA